MLHKMHYDTMCAVYDETICAVPNTLSDTICAVCEIIYDTLWVAHNTIYNTTGTVQRQRIFFEVPINI